MSKTRRVVSIIFLFLAIGRAFFPNLIKIPNVNIDGWVLFFILVGIIMWNYTGLVGLLKKSSRYKNNLLKICIIILCINVIILRMFFENIRFDNTSLYILILLIVTMLIPDLQEMLLRIRRVKKGDFELDFSEILRDLKNNIEVAEMKSSKDKAEIDDIEEKENNDSSGKAEIVKESPSKYSADPTIGQLDHFEEKIKWLESVGELDAVITYTYGEIQRRVRLLLFGKSGQEKLSDIEVLKEALDSNIISKEIYILYKKFMKVRNYVVFAVLEPLPESELREAVELGFRILKLLPKHSKK